jgi:hypothetical protein
MSYFFWTRKRERESRAVCSRNECIIALFGVVVRERFNQVDARKRQQSSHHVAGEPPVVILNFTHKSRDGETYLDWIV